MSEHSTLPPDDDTTPGYTVPAAPLVPRFSGLAEREAAFATAPDWGLAVVEEMRETRDELATAMGEFTTAAADVLGGMREIKANQTSLRRSFDDLRNEMRAKTGAHDNELEEVRGRLTDGDELFQQLQRDIGEMRGRLTELERRSEECAAARGLTGG